MGEIFRVTTLLNPDWMEDVDRLIQAAAWAIRTTVPSNRIKENKKRITHEYKVGDMIVIQDYERRKMPKPSSPTLPGYFVITKTYSGSKAGTVRIDRGAFQEDISIRRLAPYHERK